MRILIDGYWWNEGPVSNRQVLREQVLAWLTEFPDDEIHMTARRTAFEEIQEISNGKIFLHPARIPQHGLHVLLEIAVISMRVRPDAVFTQNFTPLYNYGKLSVFVHDLIFITNPEWFTLTERFYLSFIHGGMGRADTVLTSTKTEMNRISRLTRDKYTLSAVGLGIPTELTAARQIRPDLNLLTYGFWLTVGRLNIRKNLSYTVEVALASGRISKDNPLIIVGERQGRIESSETIRLAVENGLAIMTGAVSPEELSWLYSNCSVFLFGTLDEGFGLPAVEAAHFGAPSVLSDISVMREVSQNCADYMPLDNFAAAVRVVTKVIGRTSDSDSINSRSPRFEWGQSVKLIRDSFGK